MPITTLSLLELVLGGGNGLCCAIKSISAITHTHASATGANATATNQNATVTLDTTSNDPPFVRVIWIKSDGTPTGIPSNAYAFFSSDTLPASWTRVQGNRFLKGAVAGGDGGATGGSSDAHTHTNTAHNHTQNAHTHAGATSAAGQAGSVVNSTPGVYPKGAHTHSVSLNSATATNQTASVTIQNGDGQPVFKKLNVINNGTGAVSFPNSIIALWGSTNASIPADWIRFTSMDANFLKGANADGESNITTGGAATHGHTADAHTHTQDTHNHGSTAGNGSQDFDADTSSPDVPFTSNTHSHTWTIGNTVAVNQNTTITVASSSSEGSYPSYRRAIFIQWVEPVSASSTRIMLMGIGT
jgi:hypothetical protein